MNRRSFLRGSGAALLGAATLGLLGKAAAAAPVHVVWTSVSESTDNPRMPWEAKIKLSGTGAADPMIFRGTTLEQVDAACAYCVGALGWASGSKVYNPTPRGAVSRIKWGSGGW